MLSHEATALLHDETRTILLGLIVPEQVLSIQNFIDDFFLNFKRFEVLAVVCVEHLAQNLRGKSIINQVLRIFLDVISRPIRKIALRCHSPLFVQPRRRRRRRRRSCDAMRCGKDDIKESSEHKVRYPAEMRLGLLRQLSTDQPLGLQRVEILEGKLSRDFIYRRSTFDPCSFHTPRTPHFSYSP